MINTTYIFKTKDSRNTFIIVFLYCIWTKFFNFVGITTIYYGTLMSLCLFAITLSLLPVIFKKQKDPISTATQKLCLCFLLSVVWCYVYWNQTFYDSLRTYFAPSSGVFPIVLFFLLKKEKVSFASIVRSIVVITIIFILCWIIGLFTVPNPIFGASSQDLSENYESTMEQRGVIRLYMQGADFIVISIMLVLTHFEDKKKYYIFLIPLFIMLILRGTRTPFFVTTLICTVYLVSKIKHKIISFILIVFVALSIPLVQNAVMESNSDNPIIKYIQITNMQLSNGNDEQDIRVEMSEYMFTRFNQGKILPMLFGNGIPNGGQYGAKMSRLQENNYYYVVDVGFTTIFIYFGVVGLILYGLLLSVIIKTKVTQSCLFAKLYLIYLYLILPTNCSLITMCSVMVAITLYVLYLGSNKTDLIRSRG